LEWNESEKQQLEKKEIDRRKEIYIQTKQTREQKGRERGSQTFCSMDDRVDASLAKPTPRTSPVALSRVFPQGPHGP
jgi:hypothetical protein